MGTWICPEVLFWLCHRVVDEALAMPGLWCCPYSETGTVLSRCSLPEKPAAGKHYRKALGTPLCEDHFSAGPAALVEGISTYLQTHGELGRAGYRPGGSTPNRSVSSDKTTNLYCKLAGSSCSLPAFCADSTSSSL